MIRNKLILLAALLPLVACDLEISDPNNPAEADFVNNPTPEVVLAGTTGLIIGHRANKAESNGYISLLSVIGREAYNFDAADPRFQGDLMEGKLDPTAAAFGANIWVNPYANIHLGLLVLDAVGKVNFGEDEREGIRGFAKTMMALDYLAVIVTRDEAGAALVSSTDIDDIPPLVSKDQIYDHIETLLDEAETHLANAGDEFSFSLSSGFTGFNTPAEFIKVNRAIKARVEIYRGKYAEALTSLGESFITADSANPQLRLGVYHSYGTGSGDTQNELVSANFFVHPSVRAEAEAGDTRIDTKIKDLGADGARTVADLTSQDGFLVYPDVTSPVTIIRNEDLILLRAEANFEEGNLDEAIADVNFVREHSAGLAPRDDLDADNFFDELVKQRRYSLLFEGHRWIDMRRWGLLGQLPNDRPNDSVPSALPIPTAELDARR
ncbi:RagB/SusD family nutrient uptake outer membrane protein [Haliangium sp.]|uniref:RagB/SusD family nutrient uptake outer membrane protein n=1 Tax=Haliangium sp. TaxID=2663208 RepID=UPI003D14DC51